MTWKDTRQVSLKFKTGPVVLQPVPSQTETRADKRVLVFVSTQQYTFSSISSKLRNFRSTSGTYWWSAQKEYIVQRAMHNYYSQKSGYLGRFLQNSYSNMLQQRNTSHWWGVIYSMRGVVKWLIHTARGKAECCITLRDHDLSAINQVNMISPTLSGSLCCSVDNIELWCWLWTS